MSESARPHRERSASWAPFACLAVTLPPLIAYNVPPSATFFNQAASLVGWGLFLLVLAAALSPAAWPRSRGLAALLGALGLLLLAALIAPFWAALPWSLALSNAGTVAAAALVAIVGAALVEAGVDEEAFRAFCVALVLAGIFSAAIGIEQVYAPQWTDGNWIAHTSLEGRAVGNMRQPNHLSSLLLWAVVAIVWLTEAESVPRPAAVAVALLLLFGIVLSGSRTGALGTVTLALWGVIDRRLTRPARVALVLAPLAYALLWAGTLEYAQHSHVAFGRANEFSAQGDVSSSRFGIWSNTLALIQAHPWVGVGVGEFNFAWTLTPFPGRPVAFFDHTHNILLQFAVELGLPLASLVLALLAWALAKAAHHATEAGSRQGGPQAPVQRAALVMVVMVAVHSMLEYPLWYSYFLLPAAFAFGLCLVGPVPRAAPAAAGTGAFNGHPTRPLVLAAMALILGGVFALYDYTRVVVIFAPPARAAPLADRIADGRRSWLFSHHADYAAATTAEHPSEVMSAFEGAPHYLLDTRLMIAWATALDEAGDTDRARYIAARLREFRNEQAEPFFAVCEEGGQPAGKRPFQCEPPLKTYTFLDFR